MSARAAVDAPVLAVRGLVKHYRSGGGEVAALRDVSFSVAPGSVAAVVGPSGSGKTTLLNLVAGLDRPDAGEVTIRGQRLADLDAEAATDFRRRHVGFVFQFFNLIPTMTAAENVAIPLLVEGAGRREIAARAGAALAAVGLAERAARPASELSGGEMQRVAIARALIMRPPLILADEPTGNLDSVTGDGILRLLCTESRAAGRAVVLVTHSYLAAAYADRLLLMRDGTIVEELDPERRRELLLVGGRRPERP
jgi:putative ABC transport system ATP-binding protein